MVRLLVFCTTPHAVMAGAGMYPLRGGVPGSMPQSSSRGGKGGRPSQLPHALISVVPGLPGSGDSLMSQSLKP